MRHFSALILLAALGCATATGDRSAGKSWWKTPAKDDAQFAAKDEKPQDSKAETAKSNPFRKSDSATADDKPAATGKKSDQSVASADPASKPDAATAAAGKAATESFSAETLRLIDAELADATPQERTYWYEQLKRVDPAVIPQILQARRLTADVVDQQKEDAPSAIRKVSGTSESPGANSAVEHAFAEQPANAPSRIDRALHQAERGAGREFIVPQDFETGPTASAPTTPADSNPPKSSYAVRRVAATDPSPPASTPSLTRNALSRLLPSLTGAQASANTPAAVSLLPPTEIQQVSATQPQLESLISQVEAEIAQMQPGTGEDAEVEYIRRHVYLRMLYLMAHHPERALTAIPGIDPADQEFWQQTLWAMANYFDTEHIPTAKDRAGQAVAQLSVAAQRLKERADLEVRNLAFCHEIAYFGNFTRFNRDEFQPGDSVLLYAEIDNFKSELTIDGQYRTLLRSTIEVLSPSGEVRWQKEFPANEDLCINYRRDYFLNYRFNIADRLPLGPHTLKLTVFDELSGKMVSQSINFVVR